MKNNYPKKGNKACLLKRSLAFILSCAIAAPLLAPENAQKRVEKTVHAATENVNYGDVNSDGKISILDMIALKSYITEKNTKGFSVKAADLDGDGTVSAKDAVELSMFLLNQTGSFSCEMNIDTDGDGLCDYVEKEILGTDYLKKDTDGDGLDDYSEVYLCDTDPLNTDTGKTGVKDSAKDADGDKLTNAEEITLGTSPALADTDEDGLSDYDEVKKYKTNPLKEDTDGDGISDNGEIKLGLDPLKVKSDGKTSDAERIFEQKLSSDSDMLKIVNNEDSLYQLSISAKSSGYINEAVSVDISAYSNYLQNDAVAGDIIDIDYADDFKIESMKISFSVSENAERYFIFRYSEDVNMLLPVETLYDGNNIYTDYTEDGTYCLVDMDIWSENSAISEVVQSANVIYNAAQVFDVARAAGDEEIEVYFIMYASSENLDNVKSSVNKASQELIDYCNKKSKSVKLYYSSYNSIISLDSEKKYLDNNSSDDDISDTLALLKSPPANKISLSGYPIIKRLNDTWNNYGQKTSGTKYYYIINAGTNPPLGATEKVSCPANPFDPDYFRWQQFVVMDPEFKYYDDGSTIIIEGTETASKAETMTNGGAVFNVICNKNNVNISKYKNTFLPSGKDVYYLTEDFSDCIFDEIAGDDFTIAYNVNTGLCNEIPYDIELITSEWKEVFEKYYYSGLSREEQKKYFDEINKLGFPDTDGDGICDCLEINMRDIDFDKDGNVILPTYTQIGGSGMDQLIDIMNKKGKDIREIRILLLLSNPALNDSDGDGIEDKEDDNPAQSERVLVLDDFIDDSTIFSNKKEKGSIILDDSVIYNTPVYDHNEEIAYKSKQVYERFGDCKTLSRFRICPEDYSDYKMTLTSDNENAFSVKIMDVSNSKKPTKVEFIKSIENNKKSHVYSFSLKKGRTYNIDVVFNPFTYVRQQYKVSFEQDNWVYLPEGGVAHSVEHLEGLDAVANDYVDIYMTEDMLYEIVMHKFDKNISALSWDKNAKDFNFLCAAALRNAVYNEKQLTYLSMNKSECVWTDSVANTATGTGVVFLAFGDNLPFGVGAVVTVVGGIATYFSMLSADPEGFQTSIYNTFNIINNQIDDPDKLNIKLSKYSIFGVEQFSSIEWNNTQNYYSYVNKYAQSHDRTIFPYKCRLQVVSF